MKDHGNMPRCRFKARSQKRERGAQVRLRHKDSRTRQHWAGVRAVWLLALACGAASAQTIPKAVDDRITAAQSAGDNAWMLVSAALVLLMTGPGLALFYGGLVRTKNVLGTMMQ